MNKKYFGAGIFILILFLNTSCVLAAFEIDQYEFTTSEFARTSMSPPAPYSSYSQVDSSSSGSFIKYQKDDSCKEDGFTTCEKYWVGSGEGEVYMEFGEGCSGGYVTSWQEHISTLECTGGEFCTLTTTISYGGSGSCDGGEPDYYPGEPESSNIPVDGVKSVAGSLGHNFLFGEIANDCPDFWYSKPLSNCLQQSPPYEYYEAGSEGGRDYGGFYCNQLSYYNRKSGYCEAQPQYPRPEDDYTCDQNAEQYLTGIYTDPSKFAQKAEDARHNLDENGDGVIEGCCPESPDAKRKYKTTAGTIVTKDGVDSCKPQISAKGIALERCVECTSDSQCNEGTKTSCCNGKCYDPNEDKDSNGFPDNLCCGLIENGADCRILGPGCGRSCCIKGESCCDGVKGEEPTCCLEVNESGTKIAECVVLGIPVLGKVNFCEPECLVPNKTQKCSAYTNTLIFGKIKVSICCLPEPKEKCGINSVGAVNTPFCGKDCDDIGACYEKNGVCLYCNETEGEFCDKDPKFDKPFCNKNTCPPGQNACSGSGEFSFLKICCDSGLLCNRDPNGAPRCVNFPESLTSLRISTSSGDSACSSNSMLSNIDIPNYQLAFISTVQYLNGERTSEEIKKYIIDWINA